ncbi:MAG: NAD-dependent succinate-semialdehyde dehydrogenase [Sandaracinaceae bacterium]
MTESFRAVDPATGELLREHPADPPEQVLAEARRAAAAQRRWARSTFPERAACLRRLADGLDAHRDELARLVTREMGKPIGQAEAEAAKCALAARHYATHAEAYLADVPVELSPGEGSAAVVHRPLGVVLAVMPWNFPLWQVVRAAAPALMAGNGVVLKHAPNVPGCAEALATRFGACGLPEGLFAHVRADVETTGRLIDDDAVAAVTLTGSSRAGAAVASRAGASLKPCVLELGGSDPFVVLPDADVDRAADLFVASRMVNSGQSCIAAKRLIVTRGMAARLERAVVERLRGLRRGPPSDRSTELGPLAREDLRDELHRQVERSVAAGARLALGGTVPDEAGWWYPATVLADVPAGSPAADEELFGPVAAILVADDVDGALRRANASPYGLGATVVTGDAAAGERLARERLEVGCVFVNGMVRSDPRLPFGGVKASGFGRELGRPGILEFVNVKTVVVATST